VLLRPGTLTALEKREDDHLKAACEQMASKRHTRYLNPDWRGRPKLDAGKVKAAEKFDGKFVVITNATRCRPKTWRWPTRLAR
jgi:hypothetical protein